MAAPFRVGDRAVWIDADPKGLRVSRTTLVNVRPDGDGWTVVTLAGTERVDERGEGSRLVPLDTEMAVELEDRGTSFVGKSTVDDIERNPEPGLDWRLFEHDLDRDGIDRYHGPEHGHGS